MRFPNSRKHVCAPIASQPMNIGIYRLKRRCAVKEVLDNQLWTRKEKSARRGLLTAQADTENSKIKAKFQRYEPALVSPQILQHKTYY